MPAIVSVTSGSSRLALLAQRFTADSWSGSPGTLPPQGPLSTVRAACTAHGASKPRQFRLEVPWLPRR